MGSKKRSLLGRFVCQTRRKRKRCWDAVIERIGKDSCGGIYIYCSIIKIKRDCARFEWSALDWNTPAINFYKSMGAKTMDGWTVFRLDGEALKDAAL